MPLTQAQLDSFRLNGFLHIPQLIPPHELAGAQADSKALIDKGMNGPIGDNTYCYGRDATDPDKQILFRINGLLHHHGHESFKCLLAYPPLLDAINSAVGGDHFVSSVHSIVFKVPHRGLPVPWHQDPVKVFHFPLFNVDIYLDEAHPGNGGLYAIPHSHLAGYHGDNPDFVKSWTLGKEADAPGAVPVNTKPGDVIFHATSVLHGSFWNRSDSLRRTIYFHIDHLKDARLQPPGFPGDLYMWAQDVTADAIASRKRKYPSEKAFDYKLITEETYWEGRQRPAAKV